MTLTTRTVQGVGWSGISQLIRLISHFVIIAILARLLTPNDFGLIAMVVVFTSFVLVFRDFGLPTALIQRKGLTEEHLSSIFWINLLLGLIFTLILAALAPAIAGLYNENRLVPLIMVLASTFFISSFGRVQSVLFTKQLKFKILAIVEISAVGVSGTAAIILALYKFGVWSLVWQQIISCLVIVILLWSFSRWKPKFLFKWRRVKELLGFGLNLTGFSFVNHFNRNLDNFLIGKFLGSLPLGFYNLAYRLLLFPLKNISSTVGRVMFPSLSSIQDDKSKVRHAYLTATRYIATITFPLMIGLLVAAPQFIRVIFGSQWERSILLVQILVLVGLIQSIGTTVGWIYQSQGRTDIMFRWGIFSVTINITAFIIGLRWNVEGVAIAYAIASFLLIYPSFAIPFKLIDLKFIHFIKQFKSISLAMIGMGGIIFILRLFLKTTLEANDLLTLISTVIVGIISYTGLLFVLDKSLYQEIIQLIKHLKTLPSSDSVYSENSSLKEESL